MRRAILRQAKLNNLKRVIFIKRRAYKTPYKKNTPATLPHEPKDIAGQFRKNNFFIIVALVNEKIVGAIKYKIIDRNILYFYQLAVLKTYRNKHIGSSLVNKVEIIAEKIGARKILLDCMREKKLPENYKKLGYRTDAIKKHHDHHDAYMSKLIK